MHSMRCKWKMFQSLPAAAAGESKGLGFAVGVIGLPFD